MGGDDQRTDNSNSRRWSRGDRIGAAGVAAAAVTALMGLALDGWFNLRNEPSSDLAVVAVDATAGDFNPDLTLEPSTVRLAFRNAGEVVSVVSDFRLTIRNHSRLEICQAGGGLDPSGSYDTELPTEPAPGQVVSLPIVHEVPANGTDRVELRLQIPEEEAQSATHVYQLHIDVTVDGKPSTEPVATVVIPVPTTLQGYLDAEGETFEGPVGECYKRNSQEAARIETWDGVRPPNFFG